MSRVQCLVLSGNGTNCEQETAHACAQAGADQVDVVPIWDLLAGQYSLDVYNFLCLPGGFLDGDDLGAAKAMAWRLTMAKTPSGQSIAEQLARFVTEPRLVLGICNGFQLMAKLGLIPTSPIDGADAQGKVAMIHDGHEPEPQQQVTIWANDSGRFEDRWVRLTFDQDSPCIFTKDIEDMWLPIRHGEGKVIYRDRQVETFVADKHLVPLRYADPQTGSPTQTYPHNPNGSPGGTAGLCDPTGRLFGLMPHPEAFHDATNHPAWTSLGLTGRGAGLAFFDNAVSWLRKNG